MLKLSTGFLTQITTTTTTTFTFTFTTTTTTDRPVRSESCKVSPADFSIANIAN